MNYREAYNIEDLRRIAAARLPRIAYDFLERGAEEEVTLASNRAAFERIRFQPRTLVDVSGRSQKKTLWGKTFDAPFGVAPTGASGMYCFDADVKIARAARRANLPCVLSTASFVPMERVIEEAGGTLWFQLYMSKDLETAERLVRRALAAGFEALVMTTDIPVAGNREFNRRNKFEIPLHLGPRQMLDGLLHPRWLLGVFLRTLLTSGIPRFQNLDVQVGGRIVSTTLTGFRERRDALNWEDFAWLRRLWPGKLLVKGILTVEDAQLALRHGADGIFVSNHGGRQLDGAPSPIEILPRIVDAVGGQLAIMVDSGFRRGTDIVKALALGADIVFVGRAALYGASAGEEEGVLRALDLLKSEVDRVMALIGCPTLEGLDARFLRFDGGLDAGEVAPSESRRQAV